MSSVIHAKSTAPLRCFFVLERGPDYGRAREVIGVCRADVYEKTTSKHQSMARARDGGCVVPDRALGLRPTPLRSEFADEQSVPLSKQQRECRVSGLFGGDPFVDQRRIHRARRGAHHAQKNPHSLTKRTLGA